MASVACDTFVTRAFRMFYFLFPTFRHPTTRPPLRLWLARCAHGCRLCTVAQIYTPAHRAPSPYTMRAPSRCVLRYYSFIPCPYVLQARVLVPRTPAFQPHRHSRQTLNRTPRPWCCSTQLTGVVYFYFSRLLGAGVRAVVPSLFAGWHSPPNCAVFCVVLLSLYIVLATFVYTIYVYSILFVSSNHVLA